MANIAIGSCHPQARGNVRRSLRESKQRIVCAELRDRAFEKNRQMSVYETMKMKQNVAMDGEEVRCISASELSQMSVVNCRSR